MFSYTVSVDREPIGDMQGQCLKDWQIERMVQTFAKAWGISPKGIRISKGGITKIQHRGMVK